MSICNDTDKWGLLAIGIALILLGLKTFYQSEYYFHGAHVDFTGHQDIVGSWLILIGIILLTGFFRSSKK
jgi:hypothetical protein